MAGTVALQHFRSTLRYSASLISIESRYYADPPSAAEIEAVLGLRGGAAVLMVAAFEAFLRELLPEVMTVISDGSVNFNLLPDDIRVQSVFGTLDEAMSPPRFGPSDPKVARLPSILAASQSVLANRVNPDVFGDTNSSPDSNSVRRIFKAAGIPNVFDGIRPSFENKWKISTTLRYIPDTLDVIVQRRHNVAHTADALNISRRDLKEAVRFLRILAESLDRHAMRQTRVHRRTAKI